MRPLAEYGRWALVTGASAGIGEAFARAIAEAGVNVVLTARREDRLKVLATELETQHHVETRVLPVDLGVEGAPDRIAAATADLEIGILVNNAGFGLAGRFETARYEKLMEMVRLNCSAVAGLTHLFLGKMKARGRGAVIIVSSVAAYQPVPLHSAYAATKAFDLMLAEGLWVENRGSGVDVVAVSPGPTETEFQQVAGETAHPGAQPSDVVATAFKALGRKPSAIVGAGNRIQTFGTRFAPRKVVARLAHSFMRRYTPKDLQ